MDAVKEFNAELCSLYEIQPPVTKAKMSQITKTAIKALKFYKHVVQSVEKFIQKCRQEYKVPGLYIIDSIIRCSRKQFGPNKDMFAPRFSKNIVITFHNLFDCPPEDISRMIRVLNLWQKNGVYHPGIIQPLLDLASDPHNPAVFETGRDQLRVEGWNP